VENPLTRVRFDVPFDRIRPEHVEPAVEKLLEDARAEIERIASEKPTTYDASLGALERSTETLEWAMNVVGHLEAVVTTPELRKVYNAIKPKVSAFYSSIPLHDGLYRALRDYAATSDAKALSGARARHLEKTLREFRRHGAELGPEDKKRLQALDVALTEATTAYSQNVLDSTAAFELVITDESKLAGLPDSAREAAREAAMEKGREGWRFTLQAPSVLPVLSYLDDPGIREQVWRAYHTRATEADRDNRPLLTRILELRREKAELLGYANFADLVLEERMAKSAENARAFVDDLRERTLSFFAKENEELLAFRRELEGPSAPAFKPWDVGYYSEKLRRARFDFDDEELRPYFAVDRVLGGLFATVERLYGIRVEKLDGVPTWHKTVTAYRLSDGDRHIGSFYVDLFPRETKRSGAWMMDLLTATPPDPQLGLFCANVNPPVGDKPALLTHRDVETLFHEFGHLLHHLLTRVEVRSLAGTNVAWDFVELPSQIMENWCWEESALALFARHYETDEPIPHELFEKMKRARTFRAANMQMRQLGFASVDLALHVDWDGEGDPLEVARSILERHSAAPLPPEYALVASFTHLFASPVAYAAGYYSYKWAEVLDADAFSRFKAAGVFDSHVGREFRERILEKGDSADPMELYRSFMGRDPRLEPLFERQGLV
jgi:oligopeptidase A